MAEGLSVAKFASLCGISRQRVYELIGIGRLKKTGRTLDPENADNLEYLQEHCKPTAPVPAAGGKTPQVVDLEGIIDALGGIDISRLGTNEVQKVARLEAAYKTRVDREIKRGDLISRIVVQTVFGKLHTIDVNELRTLGMKLAPAVCGLCGVEDAATVLKVEGVIDAEVFKTLKHIKRVLNDFLTKADCEVLA